MKASSGTVYLKAYFCCQVIALAIGSIAFLLFLQVPANPYIAFALTGSALGYAGMNRRWAGLSHMILLAAAYLLIYWLAHGRSDSYPAWWLAEPGGFLGLSAIVLTMFRWFQTSGKDEGLKRQVTMLAAIPALCSLSVLVVGLAMRLTPLTYDYALYAFDHSLGSPSFVTGRWFATHSPFFFSISAVVYNMLPLWVSLTWMWLIVQGGEQAFERRMALVILGVIGFGLYQLCPAAGPAYRFAGMFPFTNPDPALLPSGAALLETGARNAMPSLHISWTLMILVCTLSWHWSLRVAATFICGFTLLAMLGSGEHYLIDAVVALPLVAGVLAGPARSLPKFPRAGICAMSAMVVLGWLLAFRTGTAISLNEPGRLIATAVTGLMGATAIVSLAWLFREKPTFRVEVETIKNSAVGQLPQRGALEVSGPHS